LFWFNRNIKTICVGIKANKPKQLFQNKPKQSETNRKNPKFFEKIPKYASYQNVSVGLLFVSKVSVLV
jgi:hypothetical protein